MRVSVIVALYNTGTHLSELVRSLDEQSMPADQFEVILVDDGSTDDTLSRARDLAAARTNVVVETIQNSGWPGRPRNVGFDRARGDYVFFSDHDDVFRPRALERMHAMAVRNGSDVVYGKLVGRGRETPYWALWGGDVDVADPAGLPMNSRTVHKLYRRAFLVEHGIRFREGRIRLEDHEFMALVLSHAPVISILASEPCYVWIHRSDGTNTSDTPIDPADYWGYYDHVLATWERAAGPGRLLDEARVTSAMQAFSRFSARHYLRRSPASRADLFHAVSGVFARHVPPELDARLPVLKRLRAQALRDGDRLRFDAVQHWRTTLGFHLETADVEVVDGRLRLAVVGRCFQTETDAELPIDWSQPRAVLPAGEQIVGSPEDRSLLDSDLGSVEVTVRHRGSGVEWPVALQRSTRGPGLVVRTEAEIDLDLNAFGDEFERGIWDVRAHVQFLGETLVKRVAAPKAGLPKSDPSHTSAYVTAQGMLSFKVRRPMGVAALRWAGGSLEIELDERAGIVELLHAPRDAGIPAHGSPVYRGKARLNLATVDAAQIVDLWARDQHGITERLAYAGAAVETEHLRRNYSAYRTAHGSLSVKVSTSRRFTLRRARSGSR